MYGDTVVARLILAMVAALWAAMLLMPGDTFERPVYANMALIASESYWAVAWLAYAIALFVRTLSRYRHRKWITFAINGAGVLLFGAATACIVFSRVWPAPAATAGDIGLSLVAVWLFMRSGLNNEPGWRDD